MKAKFVYENMGFERGVDPKAVMGLGMRERIKKMMEEDKWGYEFDNDNALAWASYKSHIDFVEFLLKAGANVHAKDNQALRWASENGHTDVVKLLLKAGANVHALDDYALRWASNNAYVDVVEVLLKAGADVYVNNNQALEWAKENGHKDAVKLLKKWMKKNESFVYENIRFERGLDPKKAMGIGMRERIKKMMEKNNRKYTDDDHALGWASYFGHIDIVEFLLKAGADVHVEDDHALQWASYFGHIDIVEILLKAGADIYARNILALEWASQNDHKDVVKLLKKWMKKNESFVYENMRFERGVDPKVAMGLGIEGWDDYFWTQLKEDIISLIEEKDLPDTDAQLGINYSEFYNEFNRDLIMDNFLKNKKILANLNNIVKKYNTTWIEIDPHNVMPDAVINLIKNPLDPESVKVGLKEYFKILVEYLEEF